MNTKIIMAFPGCGKTTFAETHNAIDLDSSKFRKNHGWENRYISVIHDILDGDNPPEYLLINEYDKILHLLRDEIERGDLPEFTAVIPHSDDQNENLLIKQMMFGRFILRNNFFTRDPERWMESMKKNYDKWSDPDYIDQFTDNIKYITLRYPFLSDLV